MRCTSLLASILVSMLALGGQAKADHLADIMGRKSLTCGVLDSFEPFGFRDPHTRQLTGMEVDLCRTVARHLGVEAQPKGLTSEARLPELLQSRVDMLASLITWTRPRTEQIEYSKLYLADAGKLLVRKDSNITSAAQITTQRISAIKGAITEQYLRERYPNAQIVNFPDPSSAFLALQQGKVDAYCNRETALRRFQIRAGDETPMLILPEVLQVEHVGFAFRKGADEASLIARVNQVLSEMETSGEADTLFNKWLGSESPYKLQRTFKFGGPIEE